MSISTEIINVINDLCNKFGIVVDWTAENVMPYLKDLCKRYIEFEIKTSIFWIILMSSICVLCWIITIPFCHKSKKLDWDFDYGVCAFSAISIGVSVALSLMTVIVIGVQVYDIIEAANFPEKTIYDYVKTSLQSKLQSNTYK